MQNANNNGKDKEVDISYTFNHPREKVFNAWINPQYLQEWFAPHGCTIRYNTLEIKEGGKFHSCISNPDFGDCWCIGIYHEITAPEKIVYTIINADAYGNAVNPASVDMDPEWPGETLVTVTFVENNGITTIHVKQTVSETLARKTGAYPSWIQMLERLQSLIANQN